MSADLTRPRNSWEFTPAHQSLLSRMSKESGIEARLDPPVDHTGEKAGFSASLLAHLALVAFFVIGLNWNTEEPAAFEAVMWAEMPANEPTAVQQPEAKPVPVPPKPEPVVEAPPPPKPVQPPKADIELPKPETKPEPKKKPEPKPAPKPEPKPEPKKPETKKPEPKPEPKPVAKIEPKIDPALAKKAQQEDLARIMGGSPNTGSSSSGTSRNKAQYSDKIRQYVRSKLVFPGADSLDGNPEAVFEIKQLPNGEIVSIVLKKSSGLSAWDSAVERALQRSSPLPKAEDGSVEPLLLLTFRPKDAS